LPSFDEWFAALARGAGATYEQVWSAAFGASQHIGQQGYLTADAIVALGRAVGAGPGTRVLDVCCGPGAPVALLARRLGCSAVGVDRSGAALRFAAGRAGAPRYVMGDAMSLPFATAAFDSVVMFHSMLAIPDKTALLREVARVLVSGGRFGCTAEVGTPLDGAELAKMEPDPLAHVLEESDLLGMLRGAGLLPRRVDDLTRQHAGIARRLADAMTAARGPLARDLGTTAVDAVLASTLIWADLFERRRVAAIAIVAQRQPSPA